MATRTVTGNIRSLTDSAVAAGTVTFQKLVTSTTGSTIHQHGTGTATTDSNGDFSIALAVPATGSYRYWMTLPNGTSFYFNLASGASVNVATLIITETITDQDAVVEALAGYEPVLGNPASNGYVLSSTTAGVRSWVAQSGGGAVDSVFGRTGVVVAAPGDYSTDDISDDSDYAKANLTAVLNSIAQTDANQDIDIAGKQDADSDLTAIAALTPANDDVLQRKAGAWTNRTMAQLLTDLSAKLSAIDALTWAANSIILLTGTATASVQALAAHIVTFLQSATAADARTAIGAGTGNGDLLAANNLSDVTASTARSNLAVPGLADANTFTAAQMVDGTADAIQLRVQAHSSQTANIATWENSGGTVLTAINSAGRVFLPNGGSSTPALSFVNDTNSGMWLASTGRMDFITSASTALVCSSSAFDIYRASSINLTDAATNSISAELALKHNSSGTAAAGFGTSITVALESSTTNNTDAGRLVWLWNTATHASRVPDLVAYLTDASAEREILRGRATGSAAAIGFLGATPVARQAHIADASGDDAATVNAILDVLEAFGLVATS